MKTLSEIVANRVKIGIQRVILVTAVIGLLLVIGLMSKQSILSVKDESKLNITKIEEILDVKLTFIDTVRETLESKVIKNEDYSKYVDQLVTMYDDISAVYICVPEEGTKYKDGIQTYMSGGWVPPEDFVVSDREWFKKLKEEDTVYISEPYVDEQSGNICITISNKFNTEKGMGVIGLDMYLSDLTDLVKSMNTKEASVTLVSKGGTIIASENEALKLNADKSTSLSSTKYNKLNKDNFVKLILDYKGGYKMGVRQTSNLIGWQIIYVKSILYSSLYLLSLIIVVLIVMLLSRKFTVQRLLKDITPMFCSLEDIANNIHYISDGNLEYRFKEDKQSLEVYNVIRALNSTIEGLNKYIVEIDKVVKAISKKDISVGIKEEFVGDYNSIKSALIKVIEELNNSFREIKENTDTVLEYSNSLSSTSESVAEAATLQSQAVLEANEDLEKLSISMKEIYNLATKVKETNTETNKRLTIGEEEMEGLVKAMTEIVECFDGINSFVSEINDIASQTNLLSLNASIEAARAGEAGRGFAVVAGEIQSLSVNSSKASKNINEIIERTRQAVSNGNDSVERTKRAIELGIEHSIENTKITDNIVSEVSNQKDAIEGITTSFKDISTMVESNAASAEENSAIAIQLGECAEALSNTIGEYILKEE